MHFKGRGHTAKYYQRNITSETEYGECVSMHFPDISKMEYSFSSKNDEHKKISNIRAYFST